MLVSSRWPVLFLVIALALPYPASAKVARNDNYTDFSNTQFGLLSGMAVANLLLALQDPPDTARWNGGILFDGPVRSALRLDTRDARDRIGTVGDIMLYSLVAYPGVVDAGLDAGLSQKDGHIASQMFFANTQAFLLTGLAVLLFKQVAARNRPYQGECASDPNYDSGCNRGESRVSFFSGHTAFSFTGAGLICAHHKGLDLAGGMTPCYISIGAAFLVGLTRILADRHYASDVLVGAVVGWLSGYTMTRSAHYSSGPSTGGPNAMVMPNFQNQGLGLTFSFGL